MSVTHSIPAAQPPSRLTRLISALRPYPLRRKARDEIAALQGGLSAFAQRYALDETVSGMAELEAATSATPPVGERELAEQLRSMVEESREYLHQLQSGKLPHQIPEFAEMVAALEGHGSSSAAGISACAELAGLLRKIDQLDNHWLAEARRKRRLRNVRRVGRDVNDDHIDDSVQQPRPTPAPSELSVDQELSELDTKTLTAEAIRCRDGVAERVEREKLDSELDDEDKPVDSSVAFWEQHGEEIALLLVILKYCSEGTEIVGSSRAAELMKLPPNTPPFKLLKLLIEEFEGVCLPIDADYDARIVYAIAAGISPTDAVLLNREKLLDDKGMPKLDEIPVIDSTPAESRGRVQATQTQFGVPSAIATQAPWQPADPSEIAKINRRIQSQSEVA